MRPLSGNVFMRHSSKHGWVAKAYPEYSSIDSNSDLKSGSLDSFFDDEFEEEEKLVDMLSCNTLGVEKKVHICCHQVPP